MPDFERLFRQLEIELSSDKELVKSRHQGEDKARKEIAIVACVISVIVIVIMLFID